MRLDFSLAASLALTLVTASPVQLIRRQQDLSSQELDAIRQVSSGLTALNDTLNTFTTNDPVGLFEALKVQLQTSQVSNQLMTAAQTAKNAANFTSDESGQIATAVVNLEPVIFSVLNNIVTHKPAFATAILFIGDISRTVEQNLVQQQQLSKQFSDALTVKLAQPYAGFAPLIAGQIDSGECSQLFP